MERLLVEIIDIKSNFDKGSKGRDGDSEEHFKHLREFLYCEHTVGRNMNMKGVFGKTSDGNEEHVIGQWRKRDPCYDVAENLAGLSSAFG